MRSLSSLFTLFLSLFALAIAQGGPAITAAPPTASVVVLTGQQNTQTAQPSAGVPISQGLGSTAIIISGTRTPDSSRALILDTTAQTSSAPPAGTTITQTTTASRTAAGNIAPTKAPNWQSWMAVIAGGLIVAAGLM